MVRRKIFEESTVLKTTFRDCAGMARNPSEKHILRTVRQKLGLSQRELAQRVKVSASAIKQIENGRMKLSQQLANRLAWATTIKPERLRANLDPENAPPLAYSGKRAKLMIRATIGRRLGRPVPEEVAQFLYGTKRQNRLASVALTRLR